MSYCTCGKEFAPKYVKVGRDTLLSDKCDMCLLAERIRTERMARVQARIEHRKRLQAEMAGCIPLLYRNARKADLTAEAQGLLFGDDSVYLYGNTGVGKTYASMALIRHEIVRGKSCKRVNFKSLLLQIRASYADKEQSEQAIIKPLLDADVSIIDDIGIDATAFNSTVLYNLVDYRLENMKKTVIISNLSLEKLKDGIDQRLFSRLMTYSVVQMRGNDYRVKG